MFCILKSGVKQHLFFFWTEASPVVHLSMQTQGREPQLFVFCRASIFEFQNVQTSFLNMTLEIILPTSFLEKDIIKILIPAIVSLKKSFLTNTVLFL